MGKNKRRRREPQHPSAAETADDNSPDNWPLLSAEWRLTFERSRSKELADRLVQRYLEGGERDHKGRRRYRIWEIESMPGAPSPRSGDFWRSYPDHDIYCVIDREDSSARWTGPASELQQQMFGRRIVKCHVRMIQLNHGLYLEFLQSSGLPSSMPATAEPAVPTAPPAASVSASSTIKVELPDKIKVQLVDRPAPRARTQSPSRPVAPGTEPQPSTLQLTDAQIEEWVNDPSVPRTQREIRRFVVKEFGRDWRSVSTATIIKAARESTESTPSPARIHSIARWNVREAKQKISGLVWPILADFGLDWP